jgi:TPR repeat protein
MAMHHTVPMRRALELLCVPLLALSLGCSDFDRLRVRAWVGDPTAQLLVGHEYELGENVPQDLDQAAEYFERAVEQGQPHAFARLGVLYALGAGVPRDPLKAHTLFELGFRRGQLSFAIYAKKLEYELTTEQIAESLAAADAWEASH